VRLADYPGSADIISGDDPALAAGVRGSELLLARLPTVSSTHLGPGRNKLFLRGLADSSFNGPTQATTGQYLGETRINYNAPDPDLRLHDVERIEVMSGPQGTLYGAGSLGGIIRILPNRPQLDAIGGTLSLGLSAAAHGQPGGDMSATINLPIVKDRLGLRLAGYGAYDGGYIDDTLRGEADVNSVTTWGGRGGLRLAMDSGWTVDLGATVQAIRGDDGQFADQDAPPLTRRSPVGQPFSSDYLLADLVLTKEWAWARLVSAFGYVRQELIEQFDSSLDNTAPRLFRQDSRVTLLSAETRLSGGSPSGFNWVAGLSFISNDLDQRRRAGPVDAPLPLPGVSNDITEFAAFVEGSYQIAPAVTLAAGGRLTHSRLAGESLEARLAVAEPLAGPAASRDETIFLPSMAVQWDAGSRLALYARYQESFRPGGLAVAGDVIRRFRNDDVASFEGGLRWSPDATIAMAASVAYTYWSDIQADTIGMDGFPTTANIGDGTILSADLRLSWRPLDALSIEAGLVVNQSKVTDPQPVFLLRTGSSLPNVADVNARVAADYRIDLPGGDVLRLGGNLRHTGRSTLGVGPVLGIEQGDWLDVGLGVRWERGPHSLSLDASNLLDQVGNRFAYGSPFTLFFDPQVTPMRPRTLRLGYQIRF
jgi:outer membrane receptor protein involved in Fe transport